MAITGSYNTVLANVPEIYRATSGGTVFSANLAANTAFDYFTDTAVINDALYFANGANGFVSSDYVFNVGTAIAGTGIILKWEYYKRSIGWVDIEDLVDDTVGFTILGINRVRFPLQWSRNEIAINSLSRTWIRCRISGLTTITEGGANITNRVQYSDGKVTIAGGTDAIPATFTDLYNWCIANIPYVKVSKRNDYSFNFTKIAFAFSGRCITTNEVIEVGANGASSQGQGSTSLNVITSGIKVGTRGYSGSTFIVYGCSNTGTLTSGNETKMYGSIIKGGKFWSDTNNYAGYLNIAGEWIDNTIEQAISMPSGTMNYTKIVCGLLIASGAPNVFADTTYLCSSYQLFYVYLTGFTLPNFAYKFMQGSGTLFYIYQGSGKVSPEWVLLSPSTPLGLLGESVLPCAFGTLTTAALTAVKFYDASASTYTDYTTQANSATVDDVPLDGDVGDYYLFGFASVGQDRGAGMDWIITAQTNDYVYAWEFTNNGTVWTAVDANYVWDGTINLRQSGRYVCTNNALTTVTINGTAAQWLRLRIVTKGTGTPKASKVTQYLCSGVSKWSLKEKYSVDIKVVDSNGTAINGATVLGKDQSSVQIFSVNTDNNGVIVQQTTTVKEFHFDPIGNPTTSISQNVFTTFSLTISKIGYESYVMLGIPLGKKLDLTIALKPVTKTRYTFEGKPLRALTPESGSSSKLLEL